MTEGDGIAFRYCGGCQKVHEKDLALLEARKVQACVLKRGVCQHCGDDYGVGRGRLCRKGKHKVCVECAVDQCPTGQSFSYSNSVTTYPSKPRRDYDEDNSPPRHTRVSPKSDRDRMIEETKRMREKEMEEIRALRDQRLRLAEERAQAEEEARKWKLMIERKRQEEIAEAQRIKEMARLEAERVRRAAEEETRKMKAELEASERRIREEAERVKREAEREKDRAERQRQEALKKAETAEALASSAVKAAIEAESMKRSRLEARIKSLEESTPLEKGKVTIVEAASAECSVCMDSKPDTALVPCGHLALCFACTTTLMASKGPCCPICRAPATGKVKVFVV